MLASSAKVKVWLPVLNPAKEVSTLKLYVEPLPLATTPLLLEPPPVKALDRLPAVQMMPPVLATGVPNVPLLIVTLWFARLDPTSTRPKANVEVGDCVGVPCCNTLIVPLAVFV